MLDVITGQTCAVVFIDKLCGNVSSLRTNEALNICQGKTWLV